MQRPISDDQGGHRGATASHRDEDSNCWLPPGHLPARSILDIPNLDIKKRAGLTSPLGLHGTQGDWRGCSDPAELPQLGVDDGSAGSLQ